VPLFKLKTRRSVAALTATYLVIKVVTLSVNSEDNFPKRASYAVKEAAFVEYLTPAVI